jgi:hypothetical protein
MPGGCAARLTEPVPAGLGTRAEVVDGSITSDDSLRNASFQGVREDKTPQEIVREEPMAVWK